MKKEHDHVAHIMADLHHNRKRMKVKINLKNFTESSLCDRCKESQITLNAKGERRVRCFNVSEYVHPYIAECNQYVAKGQPTEYELKKLAWDIEVKHGRVMGFKPPEPKGDHEY